MRDESPDGNGRLDFHNIISSCFMARHQLRLAIVGSKFQRIIPRTITSFIVLKEEEGEGIRVI